MSRLRLILLSLFAIGAMSAVASASASANTEYYVGGTLLASLTAVVGLGGLQRLVGSIGGVAVEVHCTHVHSAFSIHNGLGANSQLMGLGFGAFLYTGCTVTAPKPKTVEGCKAKTSGKAAGEIETNKLKALSEGTTAAPTVRFEPETGTIFVTIEFTGCTNTSLNGPNNVTGFAVVKVNTTTWELEAKTGAGELEYAGATAKYEGNGTVETESTKEKVEVK